MSSGSSYEFKLGIFLGEMRLPFEQSLAAARELGAQYVWCSATDDGHRISELPDADR